MLIIGRYKIAFGRGCWIQTHKPVVARRYLGFFWIIREARPGDIDERQRFPLEHEGRRYYYYKAKHDIGVGGVHKVSCDGEQKNANTS